MQPLREKYEVGAENLAFRSGSAKEGCAGAPARNADDGSPIEPKRPISEAGEEIDDALVVLQLRTVGDLDHECGLMLPKQLAPTFEDGQFVSLHVNFHESNRVPELLIEGAGSDLDLADRGAMKNRQLFKRALAQAKIASGARYPELHGADGRRQRDRMDGHAIGHDPVQIGAQLGVRFECVNVLGEAGKDVRVNAAMRANIGRNAAAIDKTPDVSKFGLSLA